MNTARAGLLTVIRIPRGSWVTARAYVDAWRQVKAMPPGATVRGWDHFPSTAADVLRDFGRMVQDIITRHDRTTRTASEARIYRKRDAAVKRGAIVMECQWCGSAIPASKYIPRTMRFCCSDCQRSYRT